MMMAQVEVAGFGEHAGSESSDVQVAVAAEFTAPAALSIDQLDYISDMVLELQQMSARYNLATLTAVLASARIEVQEILKRSRG